MYFTNIAVVNKTQQAIPKILSQLCQKPRPGRYGNQE